MLIVYNMAVHLCKQTSIDIFLPSTCSNCMSASILFWYSRNFWSRLSENMSTAVDFVDDFLIKLSVEL